MTRKTRLFSGYSPLGKYLTQEEIPFRTFAKELHRELDEQISFATLESQISRWCLRRTKPKKIYRYLIEKMTDGAVKATSWESVRVRKAG